MRTPGAWAALIAGAVLGLAGSDAGAQPAPAGPAPTDAGTVTLPADPGLLGRPEAGDPMRPEPALRLDAPPAGVLRARIDNDLFGNQDQGYTSGFLFDWTQAPPADGGSSRSLYLSQALFTPAAWWRRDVVADDRPYAAVLLVGLGRSYRDGDHLVRNDVQFGWVGPLVGGKSTQRFVHKFVRSNDFVGWDNQLRNEPVFGLVHTRYRRLYDTERASGGAGAELIGNWGGRVGNLFTWANAGMELRFGSRLPDDFGTSPMRPGVPESRPQARPSGRGPHFIGFLTAGARLVLRDLTLDGNSFVSSHRVDKRHAVADLGYGFAIAWRDVQVTVGRFHRSREFEGQRDRPVYGSVTISIQY
ncbi:MAG: lipid A deacylase LpxR family protein [Lautropia sp.]